jgi:hypothetical protein
MGWGRVGRHRPLVKTGGGPMRRALQIGHARPGARVAAHRMGPWHAMLTLAMAMIEQVHMLIGPRSFWLAINILSKSHRHVFWREKPQVARNFLKGTDWQKKTWRSVCWRMGVSKGNCMTSCIGGGFSSLLLLVHHVVSQLPARRLAMEIKATHQMSLVLFVKTKRLGFHCTHSGCGTYQA